MSELCNCVLFTALVLGCDQVQWLSPVVQRWAALHEPMAWFARNTSYHRCHMRDSMLRTMYAYFNVKISASVVKFCLRLYTSSRVRAWVRQTVVLSVHDVHHSDMDVVDRFSAQVAEVLAVLAMYPDTAELDGGARTPEELDHMLALATETGTVDSLPSLAVVVQLAMPAEVAAAPLTMKLRWPRAEADSLQASVMHDTLTSSYVSQLQQAANAAVAAAEACLPGCGGLDVLDAVQAELGALPHAGPREEPTPSIQPVAIRDVRIKRVLLWYHHIRAPGKKRAINDWAAELRLHGLVKHGWPGIVYAEGEAADVDEYVHRLRGLRWKAMALRHEEVELLPGTFSRSMLRWPPSGSDWEAWATLEPHDMGGFVAAMDAIGAGAVFRSTILKIGAEGTRDDTIGRTEPGVSK